MGGHSVSPQMAVLTDALPIGEVTGVLSNSCSQVGLGELKSMLLSHAQPRFLTTMAFYSCVQWSVTEVAREGGSLTFTNTLPYLPYY